MSSSRSMKRIYLYTFIALFVGILMVFKQRIRQAFSEDLSAPNTEDVQWHPPATQSYKHKILLPLHYYNPRKANDFLAPKLAELEKKQHGIHTILLSGSPKVPTNEYLRTLAQKDWGIEEIRLHGTAGVNLFAFMNLIKANPTLKRVLIWNNDWSNLDLKKIQNLLPTKDNLTLK